jgi:putative transposase
MRPTRAHKVNTTKTMSTKYKFGEKTGAYFVSFATINWIDVFTRDTYFWNIIESLDFFRKNKGMEIYGYCIMPSHVHLIFRSANGDPSGLVRDFKGFTSKKMLKTIEENAQESRREWMLWMMEPNRADISLRTIARICNPCPHSTSTK